jgi:hypothetical protein
MNNKPLITLLLILTIILSGCNINIKNENTDNKDTAVDSTVKILTPLIKYRTYGGFVPQEMAQQELLIEPDKMIYRTLDYQGVITKQIEKEITKEEYETVLSKFTEFEFTNMRNRYESNIPIADVGSVDITYANKVVTLNPDVPSEYPENVQKLREFLANYLFEMSNDKETVDETDFLTITFQPMQCEKMPWVTWYESGEINYLVEPSQENLITDYYAQKFELNLEIVEQLIFDGGTCEACGVCPTQFYFEAQISNSDLDKAIDAGWTN